MNSMLQDLLIIALYTSALVEGMPAVAADLALPTDAAVRSARTIIRGTFKEDYQKPPKDRKPLIGKLMNQSNDPTNDASVQFAALLEASTEAQAIGDVSTMIWVSDTLDQRYPTASLEVRFGILENASKEVRIPGSEIELANHFLEFADEAGWSDQYQLAVRGAEQAHNLTRHSKSPAFTAYAAAKLDTLRELASQSDTLKRAPDDPANADATGAFLCFGKGQWDRGLPLLGKGKDAALAALANRDLASPVTPAAMSSLAGDYFQFGNSPKQHSALVRAGVIARGREWYLKAMPGLGGLARAYAEKQLAAGGGVSVWRSRAAAVQELRKALLATQWGWYGPDVQMTFRDDGSVSHRGMRGTYELTGPRRLILSIDNGDRMTFLFDCLADHYTSLGRGFGGDRILP